MLDVNGAIATYETTTTLTGANPTYTVAASVGQLLLSAGSTAPTGTIALSAATSPAPVAGQRLVVFNTTTLAATLNSQTIPAAQAVEFVYSSSGWHASGDGGNNATFTNGLTKNTSTNSIGLGGTLSSATTIATNGNNLTFSGTGLVGIGTTTPGATLEIAGAGSNATGGAIFLNNTGSTGRKFSVESRTDMSNGSGQNGEFVIADETAGTARLAIDQSGNVGIGTTAPSQLLDVNGTARLRSIPSSNGTVMLTADNNGVIHQQALPTASAPSIAGTLGNGIDLTSNNWGSFNYTSTYITVPANSKYILQGYFLLTGSAVPTSSQSVWVRSSFSESSSTYTQSADIVGSAFISGILGSNAPYCMMTGAVIIQNKTSAAKTYYYWAGSTVITGSYTGTIQAVGASKWSENQLIALPIN